MKVTIFYMLIGVNIYQCKTKDSETKSYPLCSGNISKGVTVDNMKKKNEMEMHMIFLWIIIL